jgi:hypothetical protein
MADVVRVRVLMSAFPGCEHGALHEFDGNGPPSRAAKKIE